MKQDEYHLRQEIVKIGQLMYQKGLISASEGNISARLDANRLLITPSGLHKGLMDTDHILVIDETGQMIGPRTGVARKLKPTSELPMHLEAYRQRPDIGAVVHAHPPITIALSIAGIPLGDCLIPEAIVFLGMVPTTAYATPSSEENMHAIHNLIRHHDAIVLQRHGSLTVGDTVMQAFMRLETVEQTARIGFMLAQLGIKNPLPAEEVRKLLVTREQMGLMKPGDAAAFCTTCGVCHTDLAHPPVLHRSGASSGPDAAAIRELVTQVVGKAMGQPY
ncbi:MAG: class II aldolase/adducin family protein [Chloroflexi bacterium]|nr:class II aldolase/adducin family protein [Chloroflexota bacterium]MBP8055551.1 class II aldolase/adducin family protein [Chloroflexota bacterium]